uniref:Palmitoyltransferase n=1 Tax=Salarias fasciatus TaxID=181472 RepID=A0A672GGH7_SALFA
LIKRKAEVKWQVFPGKNRFYCGGRIIVARQSGVLPLTLGLILVTSGLFFIFDCPFLVKHLTSCIPVIGGVLFVFVLITLLQTSFTDPGILPRATPDEAADVEKQIGKDNTGNTSYRPPPRTKEVLINQQVVKLKYCFTCKMFRPPRTSHCSLCDNCVERFDHHCPWVGNCVGKRNYRFFYTFIVSLSFLTAFIFGCVTTHLALSTCSWRASGCLYLVTHRPLELVICFFSVWSILGLSGFHTYLVASNLTTNEDIKGSWSGKSGEDVTNPYSHRNICVNCCSVLCAPMPPRSERGDGASCRRTSRSRPAARTSRPAPRSPRWSSVSSPPLPPQCAQGTKGLLESAALSASCPQGKPQTAHPGPDGGPAANSHPSLQISRTPQAVGDASPPRHSKSRAKKCRRAALHIPNPAFEEPASPTSPDAEPVSRAKGRKGAGPVPSR